LLREKDSSAKLLFAGYVVFLNRFLAIQTHDITAKDVAATSFQLMMLRIILFNLASLDRMLVALAVLLLKQQQID